MASPRSNKINTEEIGQRESKDRGKNEEEVTFTNAALPHLSKVNTSMAEFPDGPNRGIHSQCHSLMYL